LDNHRTRGASPLDIAEAAVTENRDRLEHSQLGRSLKDRVRRLKRADLFLEEEGESAIMLTALTQAFHIALAGERSSDESLHELLDATGMGALARDQFEASGQLLLTVMRTGACIERFSPDCNSASWRRG
jgi:hypothetical protein